MINEEMQDNTVRNDVPYFFHYSSHFLVKLRIQLSDLRNVASYRAKKNETVLLFSLLLIFSYIAVVCACTKLATHRPNVTLIIGEILELTALRERT